MSGGIPRYSSRRRASAALGESVDAFRAYIEGETLALSTTEGDPPDAATAFRGDLDGVMATLSVRKA